MNISQTFIERPIATSLLMAAIALFGGVAYRSLAVSDLPNVDFPTLLVTAALPGASPETMAAAVATPLENQFSTIAGLNSMIQFELARQHPDHPRIRPQPQARWRRRGRAGRHHPGHPPAAAGHADAAHLHQGQSRRSADSLSCPHFPNPSPVDPRRVRRDPHRPAHLHDQRRGPGAGAGRAEVRRARADGSARAGLAADRHQRNRNHAQELERQSAHRRHHRSAARLHPAGQRPVAHRGPVQTGGSCLSQRLPGAAGRAGHHHR